ncbi:MAG: methyltransferase domain-containing protein [Rhodobacteraceae bacterium]|nr:methyltransferase domain-containing protein [Paracoccaceae bacterium]
MGVDYVLFERLAELSTRWRPGGRSLGLGRQQFQIESPCAKLYEKTLRRFDLTGKRFDYLQEDGFYETLMRKLGFGEIESMDFSDYEGATILHDLNKPIPSDLEGRFDFILDGGTIEHVFNIPVVLENVFRMLKPGGRFVSVNCMNGWPGHGLYQFNPDLVWTFWRRTANCTVHDCRGITKLPLKGVEYHLPFPDPAGLGRRLRLKGRIPPERFYLYYEVERRPDSALQDGTLQSDYETKWADGESAGAIRPDGAIA